MTLPPHAKRAYCCDLCLRLCQHERRWRATVSRFYQILGMNIGQWLMGPSRADWHANHFIWFDKTKRLARQRNGSGSARRVWECPVSNAGRCYLSFLPLWHSRQRIKKLAEWMLNPCHLPAVNNLFFKPSLFLVMICIRCMFCVASKTCLEGCWLELGSWNSYVLFLYDTLFL